MKNFEYYEKQIKELSEKGQNIAVLKNGEITCCALARCNACAFKGEIKCEANKKMIEWMYGEHKDQVEISVLGRELLKRYVTLGYNWIARDESEKLCVHARKPVKTFSIWDAVTGKVEERTREQIPISLDVFPFIAYKDEEPWNIQMDILGNCKLKR